MVTLVALILLVLPFALIPAIPIIREQSLFRFFGILLFIMGIPAVINLIIYTKGISIINGPISILIVFGSGPFSTCLIVSRIGILWRIKIIGIVCVIFTYLIGIAFFMSFGVEFGIVRP